METEEDDREKEEELMGTPCDEDVDVVDDEDEEDISETSSLRRGRMKDAGNHP